MDHLQQPLLPTATRHSHPEEKAYQVPAGPESLWQWCSFSYIAPLLKAGAALPQLHQHHLPPLPPSAAPDKCGEALWNAWQRELVKQPSPSLLRALFSPFGPQFLSLGLLKLCNDALNFAGPLLLNGLLRYLSDQTEPGADRISTVSSSSSSSSSSSYLDPSSFAFAGGACAALLALSLFLKAFLNAHYSYRQGLISIKVRAALTSVVFQQTLALPAAHLSTIGGTGKIQTLMSVDADHVLGLFGGFHELWSLPLQIGIALFLLYKQVQFAFLAGLTLVILIIPLNKLLATSIQSASISMMTAKDRRIAIISELLRGIRAVKAAGWESMFARRVDGVRAEELRSLATCKYLDALCVYLWAATSLFFSVGTFGLYVLLGRQLTAEIVFTSLALFSVLLGPINSFPWVINGIVEATVSLRRLRSFLVLQHHRYSCGSSTHDGGGGGGGGGSGDEYHRRRVLLLSTPKSDEDTALPSFPSFPSSSSSEEVLKEDAEETPMMIEISNGNFCWSLENNSDSQTLQNTAALHDIQLSIPKRKFVAITGDVGSGKSSLLNAVLGEMCCLPGSVVSVHGNTAYAAQEPFLLPGTIRENIISFSTSSTAASNTIGRINSERYEQVLHACALLEDLNGMPAGDGTDVGTAVGGGGSMLSGGQRARVALARTLYRECVDVYLLDDVLAAVDARVGASIIQNALLGGPLLDGKTVLIVTHSPVLLAAADVVVTMREGRIGSVVAKNENSRCRGQQQSNGTTGSNDGTSVKIEGGGGGASLQDYHSHRHVEDDSRETKEIKVVKEEEEEERVVGHVRWKISSFYCSLQGCWAPITLISLTLMQATRTGGDVWLSHWVTHSNTGGDDDALDDTPHSGALLFPSFFSSSFLSVLFHRQGEEQEHDSNLVSLQPEVWYYLKVLLLLAAANSIFTLIRAFSFAQGGLVAARRLHHHLLSSILTLPPTFFEQNNACGRILNRFSSDTAIADDSLPFISNILLAQAFGLAGVAVVLSVTQPVMLLCFLPITWACNRHLQYYRSTGRELRRLDSVARSPIYSIFSCALTGGATLRASNDEAAFLSLAHTLVENQQKASLAALTAATWLGLRLQIIAGCIAAVVGGLAVANHAGLLPHRPGASQTTSVGLIGLSLVYALPIVGLLNGFLTANAETEQEMVSVERIRQYIDDAAPQPEVLHIHPNQLSFGSVHDRGGDSSIRTSIHGGSGSSTNYRTSPFLTVGGGISVVDLEASSSSSSSSSSSAAAVHHAVPTDWPQHGAVTFENVWLKYTPSGPFVLQQLSLKINAGARVGVCGRTGAGKSSLIACLLRLADICAGCICIDGVDVRSVPLKRLRHAIGFVSQSPFIFSGTVAENLDPEGRFDVHFLLDAVKKVGLWPALLTLYHNHNTKRDEDEEDETAAAAAAAGVLKLRLGDGADTIGLSQGQQQLLCLARVFLRQHTHTRIVCLDEASASVDPDTAAVMQSVVERQFQGCTVIEVAHRLRSVAACDVVYVMEGGRVLESGAPNELVTRPLSVFGVMVREQMGAKERHQGV